MEDQHDEEGSSSQKGSDIDTRTYEGTFQYEV